MHMPIKLSQSSKLGIARYFRSRSTKSPLTKLVRFSNWYGESISSYFWKLSLTQLILLILLVGEDWFSQFVPTAASIGSSLSTVGLVSSLSKVINAWSGTIVWKCSRYEVDEVVEVLSPLEANIDPPICGQLKSLFQVEVKTYCFPTYLLKRN